MRTLDIPQANSIARLLTAHTALGEETATAARVAEALGDLDPQHGSPGREVLELLDGRADGVSLDEVAVL